MNQILRLLPVLIVSFASAALAQTAVTTDGTGTAQNFPVYTGSTTLTSSILYQAGTSVGGGIGINTSTPQYSLDIHGGAAYTPVGINIYNWFGDPEGASTENITFSGEANPTGFAMIESGGDPTCWSCGAGYLTFKTANGGATLNEGMRLNAGGQLGIGTTGPQSALHVASAAVALASNGGPFGNGNVVIQALGGRSTSAGSSLSFATAANLDGSNVWEQARIIATGDDGNNGDARGRMSLQTRYADGTGTWQWNNNLVLNSAGYVGVGTPSSPTQPLEVNGSIKIDSGSLMFPDGTSLSSASALAVTSLPASIVTSSLTSVGTVTTGTWNASPLTAVYIPADVDYTDQTQTISGQKTFTGGVSVSTGGPGTPFTVQGAALGNTGGNTTFLMTLQNSNPNANYLNIAQIRNANGSDWTTATTRIQTVTDVTPQGYIDFNPINGTYGLAMGSGSSEYFRIARGGNIGIGTTTPGARLEVNGNLALTAGSGASITFPDGTIQSTAYIGTTCSTGGEQLGPATAPSGSCSTNGAWAFSQDGHATFCASGTWTTKI